jgi:hypothetical protein
MRVAETQPPFQNAKANEKPTSHISPCRSGCLPLSVSASGRENFHPLAASLLRIWQAASSKGHAALIDGCKDCKHGQGECRVLVSLGFPWIPLNPPRLDGVSKDPSTQFFPRNRLKCPWILNPESFDRSRDIRGGPLTLSSISNDGCQSVSLSYNCFLPQPRLRHLLHTSSNISPSNTPQLMSPKEQCRHGSGPSKGAAGDARNAESSAT